MVSAHYDLYRHRLSSRSIGLRLSERDGYFESRHRSPSDVARLCAIAKDADLKRSGRLPMVSARYDLYRHRLSSRSIGLRLSERDGYFESRHRSPSRCAISSEI